MAFGRAYSQHYPKDARFMATFRMSNVQTIIAQFRDFEHRFLAIGQLHALSSLASFKLHRNKVAAVLRARPRATGKPGADALVTQPCKLRIGSDSEIWRRPRSG